MNITWKGSPNFDKNRWPIDRIVIHWIGVGTLSSANNRFQQPDNSSAHYGISNNTIWQWVTEEHVAYQAGNYAMNQRSIGIEHDAGIDPKRDASEATYQTSGKLVREICERYNIPLDRTHIIGHKEVRATQCPGTVDINKIISIAKSAKIEVMDKHEERALQVLRDAFKILKVKETNEPFGNIEGLARGLVGYYESPPEVKKIEVIKKVPVIEEKIVETEVIKYVPTAPRLSNPIANFLYQLAKLLDEKLG